jgi:5-methylcytosine-specific restriction endonuclease McrA
MSRTPSKYIRPRTKPRPGRLKGEDLEALRLSCFIRDGWKCKECGKGVALRPHECAWSAHMAHIKAKRIGGDSLDNVRTLCGDCHRKEHNYGPSMTKPCPPKPVSAGERKQA